MTAITLRDLSGRGAPTVPFDRGQLRVGLIAPPAVPVPPVVYGGTELVVDQLARGLEAAGCHVDLFTTGDSTCPVARHWHFPDALGTTYGPGEELGHLHHAYAALDHVDVIHDHTLLGPLWAAATRPTAPVVTTAHGPLTTAVAAMYTAIADRVRLIAISRAQRRSAPTVPFSAVIHHGIDVDSFPFGTGDGGYLLFVGRMHPDKGVHRAITVAREARRPLVIAAKMWEPVEHRYYAEVVQPLLGDDAVYVGAVGAADKLALYVGAEALVNPIGWPEPFGLVMIEALACGTPVLAFAAGAAPEIVEHGTTGFLCTDEHDMAQRVGQLATIDRAQCRASVRQHFSTQRMVADHLALYRAVVAARAAARASVA